ncbi:MAG: valine--tRNA ligase, partial [Bacilli bacterium]|nr:valine--tRNA ligase [Bacilli bacterium]
MALDKKYEHKLVEEGKYDNWKSKGYFTAGDLSKKPYCIVIPPPNVTGKLHIGHAIDTTIQDILIRYKKAKGYDALYLPGMDHAGIATQAKIDAKLREQGTNRYELGREKFLEVAWDWKKEYAGFIHDQWKTMGLALDYSRERFTLDEGLSNAVKKVFVTLYNKGIIYRGEKIINWDPVQRTALSNIEVVYKDDPGKFYYFKYFIEGTDQFLEVATTRPETMFGDVCVVVNPNDERYKNVIGKRVINPANDELLPIIADEYVDIEFGTGAMKCTPAHDPNDFIIGEKYGFPHPICMNDDGTMNSLSGKYVGQDRMVCRDNLVKDIEKKGCLIKIEDIVHQVGHSERSDAVVEPYLSKQWFVKMKPLAEQSLANQKTDDKVNFYPERFEKTFIQWMEKVDDWCISRQLWWGHRIPAYYHKVTGEVVVSEVPPADIENYTQDEDVLDTWFSSALWPFSTLGWPNEESEDFKRYFPTTTLVTGYDIIFFWVSRMIFQSLEFTKKRPFENVLIHGLIRDSQGRKMSKSLGNGVDPIKVVEDYGADALRYFITTNSTPGLDSRFSEEKIQAATAYLNKIWNAARYTISN